MVISPLLNKQLLTIQKRPLVAEIQIFQSVYIMYKLYFYRSYTTQSRRNRVKLLASIFCRNLILATTSLIRRRRTCCQPRRAGSTPTSSPMPTPTMRTPPTSLSQSLRVCGTSTSHTACLKTPRRVDRGCPGPVRWTR